MTIKQIDNSETCRAKMNAKQNLGVFEALIKLK
jgi:hypothetical protein